MIAEGVRDTDLGAYQRAARTLLVHPLVTRTHPHADALGLVRRFAAVLGRDLEDVAGYRLELAPTCARLVKRVDRLDPTQIIKLRGKNPFDRRRYAYLCLVLGAVGRAGSQVALTELADALRRRAAEDEGLGFDPDDYRHRLAFVDVVLHLEGLGVLTPIEVSSVTWLKDPDAGEALYDVDRDAAHRMFVPPRVLQHVGSVGSLLASELSASRDARRSASRQRLGRLLLEHPVVYVDDLPDADRAYLRNQARSLAADLDRLTGAQLERRAEGVALVDTTGGFSDRRFPAGGTPAQVALLVADAIAGAVGDSAGATAAGSADEDAWAGAVMWPHEGDGTGASGTSAGDGTGPSETNADRTGASGTSAGDGTGGNGNGGGDCVLRATVPLAAAQVADLADRLDHARPSSGAASAAFETALVDPDRPGLAAPSAPVRAAPSARAGGDVGADAAPGTDTGAASIPTGDDDPPAPTTAGPFLPDRWLTATIERFVASHGKAFAAELRDDPAALRSAAVEVLGAFDLVRPVPGGVVARPAIARYRDLRVDTAPSAQLSLLDTGAQP